MTTSYAAWSLVGTAIALGLFLFDDAPGQPFARVAVVFLAAQTAAYLARRRSPGQPSPKKPGSVVRSLAEAGLATIATAMAILLVGAGSETMGLAIVGILGLVVGIGLARVHLPRSTSL